MASENAEIVRRLFHARTRKEFVELLDPEVEFQLDRTGWGETVRRGPEALADFFRQWRGAFEDLSLELELEEMIDAGDSVIGGVHQRGRGRGSGPAVEARHWDVVTVRDGKAIRWEVFRDGDEALAAAEPNPEERG